MSFQHKTFLQQFHQIPCITQMLTSLHHYFGTNEEVAKQLKAGMTTVWSWKTGRRKCMNYKSFKRLVVIYYITRYTPLEEYKKQCIQPVKNTVDKSEGLGHDVRVS